MTLYFTHEIVLHARADAASSTSELRAGYEDRPPTSDDDFVVFIAKKPIGGWLTSAPARVARSV